MANVKAKAKAGKAELEAKKAVHDAKAAARDGAKAARDLAEAVAHQVSDLHLDERAQEIAEKVRSSDGYAKTAAKSAALAGAAKSKIDESGLEDRAGEWVKKVRESDVAERYLERLSEVSDERLERFGDWLEDSGTAERLGFRRSRSWTTWLFALLGIGVGYAIGVFTAPKRGEELRSQVSGGLDTAASRLSQDTRDVSAPPAEKPLADKIRTRLGEDPRTSSLPKLNINVAEGTVFVRGALPAGADETAIRDVITSVEGVEDVDLQLTSA